MRNLVLYFAILAFSATATAEWLEFNSGCAEGSSPYIRYGDTTDNRLTFDVELSGLQADTVLYDEDNYLRFIDTPGMVVTEKTGYPEIPHVTCFVAVPDGVDLDVSWTANCLETIESLTVYPAPLDSLVLEHGTRIKEFFRMDLMAYSSTQWYPENTVELAGEFRLRDQRVAIVSVYPVQYLPSEDSLRVWGDVTVTVKFKNGNAVWNHTGLGHYDRLIGDRLIGTPPLLLQWT